MQVDKKQLLCYNRKQEFEFCGGDIISNYQRITWFHNKVINSSYPNARLLSQHFEISVRQAQRDIEYMRDSMNAPLIYCPKQRGYQYEKDYILPSFFLSENEKNIVNALAEQYQNIGSFGYWKYRNQADILHKITETSSYNRIGKEPYVAKLQMTGGRKSTSVLDYFLCQTDVDETYTYAFFDPEIFISVLIASNLEFRILSPKWLNDYMKQRLSELLLKL